MLSLHSYVPIAKGEGNIQTTVTKVLMYSVFSRPTRLELIQPLNHHFVIYFLSHVNWH
ncbi:hypothetical protein EXN66_Car011741 [Channa argus]|uniref:Uncharacterized protein n=1 Tax=Channa argus TaxID=215402 RepID=A0A6G1Q0L7_CHAAH|nr:hypothetical protein EXN66_Car011741 [Channa argus]